MAYRLSPLGVIPQEYSSEFFREELEKLHAVVLFLLERQQFQTLYAAPEKVWDGLTVKADGTTWNPGSGEGIYVYYNSTWNYLG